MNKIINIIDREIYGKSRIIVTSEHKEVLQKLTRRNTLSKQDMECLKELGFEFYNETQTHEQNIKYVLRSGEPMSIRDIGQLAGIGWGKTLEILMGLTLEGETELLPEKMFRLKPKGEETPHVISEEKARELTLEAERTAQEIGEKEENTEEN